VATFYRLAQRKYQRNRHKYSVTTRRKPVAQSSAQIGGEKAYWHKATSLFLGYRVACAENGNAAVCQL